MSNNNFPNKKRKLSARALSAILNAHIVLAVISFVTLVVLIALHLISSHNRGVFVLLIAISVVSIAAYFIGRKTWYKKAIWSAIVEKEAEDKAEAEKNGQVYCTKEQVQAIYDGRFSGKCPICGEELQKNDNFEYVVNISVNEKKEGVYVVRGYSNQVEQAYEVVQKLEHAPASVHSCPKCEWSRYHAHYKSYETRTSSYSEYEFESRDWDYDATEFHPGKLFYRGTIKENHISTGRFVRKS